MLKEEVNKLGGSNVINIKITIFSLMAIFISSQVVLADNAPSIIDQSLLSHNDSTIIATDLSVVVPFNRSSQEHGEWSYKNYSLACDAGTGYLCELMFKNNKIAKTNLFRGYDVVDFLVYIYLAKEHSYPYKVILIEAQAERGTSWYYVMVLKDNRVVKAFFIDQGRRFFLSTKEYLASHPEAEEMYINPKAFIFISISDNKVNIRLDKKYLYPSTENKNYRDYINIQNSL